MDALIIAVDATVENGGRWYTSTGTLELVCLDLCVACRSSWNIRRQVWVTIDTSRWASLRRRQGIFRNRKKPDAPRVPVLPVHVMVVEWPRGFLTRLSKGERGVAASEPGRVVKGFFRRLCGVGLKPLCWPDRVKEIAFGENFDQPIIGVAWPVSLQQLSFGHMFNQPIAGVVWPISLQQLSLGNRFSQSVVGVMWPASLLSLSFGVLFNQPIAGIVWPASLQQLSFGSFMSTFNQPISGVVWPDSLRKLSFGKRFNHPISEAAILRKLLQPARR